MILVKTSFNKANTEDMSIPPSNSGKYHQTLKFTFLSHSDIVILDNHHKEGDPKFPDRVISSRMIVQDFKGIPALARSLYTDLKVSLFRISDSNFDRPVLKAPHKI